MKPPPPSTTPRAASIAVAQTGLVYRNPRPHLRAIHAMHPTVARLTNGEMVCAFDAGQGPESFDYTGYTARSSDGGTTWSEPVRILHDHHPRRCTHLFRISRVGTNDLVGLGA